MGRRSRARERVDAAPAATPPPARRRRARALDALPPARRVLALYVAGAGFVALLVLVGIASLGGRGGPLVVLAVALVASGALVRWATERLRGQELTQDDRMLQTLAGGLLLLATLLAAASAVLLAVL